MKYPVSLSHTPVDRNGTENAKEILFESLNSISYISWRWVIDPLPPSLVSTAPQLQLLMLQMAFLHVARTQPELALGLYL